MTKNEINQLYMDMRRKKLTLTKIAKAMNCSPSLLSQFFNHTCNLSHEKELRLKQIVDEAKEYKLVRIPVE